MPCLEDPLGFFAVMTSLVSGVFTLADTWKLLPLLEVLGILHLLPLLLGSFLPMAPPLLIPVCILGASGRGGACPSLSLLGRVTVVPSLKLVVQRLPLASLRLLPRSLGSPAFFLSSFCNGTDSDMLPTPTASIQWTCFFAPSTPRRQTLTSLSVYSSATLLYEDLV